MFIDPHIHMTARTTDDYIAMQRAGIVAVIEPAFWLGQPRTEAGTYKDYLSTLVGWERFRAGRFGIRHYCAVGLNPKEANNEALAEAVLELLPLYAAKEGVVAIGEIGFDTMTAREERAFRAQLELAKQAELPVMVHTPHRNKRVGTLRSMELCREHGIPPARVVIDHNNEETVEEVLERGYWAAFTLYPHTKMGFERMAEIVRHYGPERIILDSSADWGISDPLSVPKAARVLERRGVAAAAVAAVCYENALAAYSASGQMDESDWLDGLNPDLSGEYAGNGVQRGEPGAEEDGIQGEVG